MAKKSRIMIVDDAPMMRLVIMNMLKADPDLEVVGYAGNGKEALAKMAQVNPDLVVLDIEMPEMDGLEFLRHARLKSRAKMVVLSSIAQAGSKKAAEARALGADAIVGKPSGAISYDLEAKRGSEISQVIHKLLSIP